MRSISSSEISSRKIIVYTYLFTYTYVVTCHPKVKKVKFSEIFQTYKKIYLIKFTMNAFVRHLSHAKNKLSTQFQFQLKTQIWRVSGKIYVSVKNFHFLAQLFLKMCLPSSHSQNWQLIFHQDRLWRNINVKNQLCKLSLNQLIILYVLFFKPRYVFLDSIIQAFFISSHNRNFIPLYFYIFTADQYIRVEVIF